jgi:RNA polymerase sigma factor for flagellar operon FliA
MRQLLHERGCNALIERFVLCVAGVDCRLLLAMSPAQTPDAPEVLERFNQHLRLATVVAKNVMHSCGSELELDDLTTFAREGLLDASRKFDAGRGIPFAAYARLRMRGAVIDGIRASSKLGRHLHHKLHAAEAALRYSEGLTEDVLGGAPANSGADAERSLHDHLAAMATAMALGVVARTALQEDEQVAVDPAQSPEELAANFQLAGQLRDAIAELPEKESEILRRHYLEGEQLDVVSQQMGLSKSWGSRLHTSALNRLSKRLRNLDDE